MTELTLSVPEIHCDHCKHSIEGAVAALDGVAAVEVAVEDRTVQLRYDPDAVAPDAVIEAIEEQGYEVAGPA